MSDQLFVGLAPKSEDGKEYFFYSMDDWIEVHRFICSHVDPDFPPHPYMDEESAELLAQHLCTLLFYGITDAYFVLQQRVRLLRDDERDPDHNCDIPSQEWPDQSSEDVERMIDLVNGYRKFLCDCGGCKVDGLNYGE